MKTYDLIVIGAGAAGLMCAITAAKRGHRVLVLERSNKIGKKILMSGGGRCNFTNLHISPQRYVSNNPHFCKSALSRYTQWDFIAWVEQHGIEYFEKQTVTGLSGQLFCQDSAKQIVAMLLEECNTAGVEIMLKCETGAIVNSSAHWLSNEYQRAGKAKNLAGKAVDGYYLETSLGKFSSEKLVSFHLKNWSSLPVVYRYPALVVPGLDTSWRKLLGCVFYRNLRAWFP